jgi:hypothetical protein
VTNDVASLAELIAAGMSKDAVERRVRSGAWQRPTRAVYVKHPRPLSARELGEVARAYAGKESVLTGLLVLHELGLRWLPELTHVDALVPDQVRRNDSGVVRLHRTMAFGKLVTWTHRGLRWADTERAVVDAARQIRSLRDVRGVVLGAVADRHATPDGLATELATGRRNGSALVRRAIRDAVRGCASPPEAELVDALVGRREPFLVNPEIWNGKTLVGCPDVWLVRRRVGGEVESVERHGAADTTETTYDRHERFADAGAELVHLSVRRIRSDVNASAAHFLARAAQLHPAPAHLRVVPRGPVLR